MSISNPIEEDECRHHLCGARNCCTLTGPRRRICDGSSCSNGACWRSRPLRDLARVLHLKSVIQQAD